MPKKLKRDPEVVKRFLKKKGLTKAPPGKQVDHIKPLEDGGSDTVRNLQLLPKKSTRKKPAVRQRPARGRKERSRSSVAGVGCSLAR